MSTAAPKIRIQNGIFKKIPSLVRTLGNSFAIITDEHLKSRATSLLAEMRRAGYACTLLVLPASERTKSLAYIEKAASSLLKMGLKRDACIIGLGGGVVGDFAGFLASIYMRGVNFVSIPTTLLAMCDSGIGGKTGVDLPEGKNMLGTFRTPDLIIMDPLLLKEMPDRAFRTGLAEVIKHGIIADKNFFMTLEKNVLAILARKPTILQNIIKRNVAIKLKIVQKDPYESLGKTKGGGSRMILNYGHTVGHALEFLSSFSLPHGEAIAIGMVAENRVAVGRKILKEADARRIESLLKRFRLPTKIPSEYSSQSIKKALYTDKKTVGGKLHFALATKIGRARIVPL